MSSVYRDFAYDVMGTAQTNAARALLEIGDRLAARCDQPAQKETLRAVQFDIAFIAVDYARVLKLLDEGIPGHDDAWRKMALGFNARRIGDILQQAGSAPRAADAYKEARDYYTQALAGLQAETAEYTLVTNELARLPE